MVAEPDARANAIELDHLTKTYGTRVAVDDLSLTVGRGELFGLLGSNGAGKSTLIRMLCGLTAPTSGNAHVLGLDVRTDMAEIRRRINLSPQETAVAANLSVAENLELVARLYGASRTEARDRARQLMGSLRITDRARDRAKSLSGGLERRLSLGMALISEPEVVFLDEPTLGLDVRSRRDLWALLRELKGTVTVVLTTHQLDEAEALCDRVAVLRDGRLRGLGPVAEHLARTGTTSFEDAFLALTDEDPLTDEEVTA
ncbi:ABC transporter ATP-binding protein [Cellulomonas sp. P22]|uniref:ABC transporter ATP-binding protein n=1 Tax=Cellulomonas sp. P22 TaxID=3373189 RepID=UPI0037A9799B